MHWSPTIGDPTPVGWVTVAAYFLAALLCSFAAFRGGRADARIWWVFAAGLLLLGINKELDLQSLLTEIGRYVARSGGWYEARQLIQTGFLAALAAAAIIGVALLLKFGRGRRLGVVIALWGMAFLTVFVLARAVSFHAGDRLIRHELAGLRLNWIFELGGIALVALGARLAVARR